MIEVIRPDEAAYDEAAHDRLDDQGELNAHQIRAKLNGYFDPPHDAAMSYVPEGEAADGTVLDLHPEDRPAPQAPVAAVQSEPVVEPAPMFQQDMLPLEVPVAEPVTADVPARSAETPVSGQPSVADAYDISPAASMLEQHGVDIEGAQTMTGRTLAGLIAGNVARAREERRAADDVDRDQRIKDFYNL